MSDDVKNEPKVAEIKVDVTLFDEELLEDTEASIFLQHEACPECGMTTIILVGHCRTCITCGWSLCSL